MQLYPSTVSGIILSPHGINIYVTQAAAGMEYLLEPSRAIRKKREIAIRRIKPRAMAGLPCSSNTFSVSLYHTGCCIGSLPLTLHLPILFACHLLSDLLSPLRGYPFTLVEVRNLVCQFIEADMLSLASWH